MKPLLFNADRIRNASEAHYFVSVWNGKEQISIARLYDNDPGSAWQRLLTRCRLGWAVFRGKYDAVCWSSDAPGRIELRSHVP